MTIDDNAIYETSYFLEDGRELYRVIWEGWKGCPPMPPKEYGYSSIPPYKWTITKKLSKP